MTGTNTAAPPAVYAAISDVMAEMATDGIGKDRKNTQQNYSFRGIDDIYNALARVMSSHRLMMLPRASERTTVERQTKNGGALNYTTVRVEFDLVSAVDGSRHTICTYGEAMDSADKATNKAMSAAFKYAAIQAFCIPTEGDNDADQTTHDVAPRVDVAALSQEWASRLSACSDMAALRETWLKLAMSDFKALPDFAQRSLEKAKNDRKAELEVTP